MFSVVSSVKFALILLPFLNVALHESGTRKSISWSVTYIAKNISSQCSWTAHIKLVQDKKKTTACSKTVTISISVIYMNYQYQYNLIKIICVLGSLQAIHEHLTKYRIRSHQGGHSFNRSITNEPATNILRGKLYKSSWSDMNMSFYNKLSHISYVVLAEI